MTKAEAPALAYTETDKTAVGFWLYLMTDCVLFATLFATYAVLQNNTFGGPAGADIFDMPFVLIETLLLLTSSVTCGIALIFAKWGQGTPAIACFALTFLLGAGFIGMELSEFMALIGEGNSWQRSGFLSGFFTLVGTHGLHVTAGLLWLIVLAAYAWKRGWTKTTLKRATLFTMFWHFLDVVWIFIFTFVYLMGVAA
ncbi:MAG TPA: cytochrome o ubiquinol oxidase subunit III [Candidatus Saccharimonadales bacterium]